MEIPAREMVPNPILPTQGLAMLYSKRGVGKTYLALKIESSLAGMVALWLVVDGQSPVGVEGWLIVAIDGNELTGRFRRKMPEFPPEIKGRTSAINWSSYAPTAISRYSKSFRALSETLHSSSCMDVQSVPATC
jgi:hypothetical protein